MAGIMLFFVLAGAGNDRSINNQSEKLAKRWAVTVQTKSQTSIWSFAEWIVVGVIFIGLFVLVLSWD